MRYRPHTSSLAPLVLLLALQAPSPGQEANRAQLREKLARKIAAIASQHDGVLGVSIKDLQSGEEISFNERIVFPTGSSIKIPILIELYKQVAAGRLKVTDQIPIAARDRVGGSGVLQHFGDQASNLALGDLAMLMIVLSDNTATNLLIEQVGMDNVNRTLDAMGLTEIRLRRKMIDQAASARGEENIATPDAARRLMEMLYRGEAVSREVSAQTLALLRVRKSSPLPRLLPPSVEIANKPGGIEGAACDWGLILVPGRPFAISVMTNYNGEGADQAIAEISKLAYDYFARLARSTPYGGRVPLELLKKSP
jgi:beta-lactamase class A